MRRPPPLEASLTAARPELRRAPRPRGHPAGAAARASPDHRRVLAVLGTERGSVRPGAVTGAKVRPVPDARAPDLVTGEPTAAGRAAERGSSV